jgi:hypothetical protein
MPNPEIEEFAKILVEWVRDDAIKTSDMLLRPNGRSPSAKRWREAARDGTPDRVATVAIPDIVDDTIFCLIQAIDQGVLNVSFVASDGEVVDLVSEGLGELSGWYMGFWIGRYTKERYVDDYSHLDDPNRFSDL